MTNRERYRKLFDRVAASGMEKMEAETVKKHNNKHWHSLPRAAAIALATLVSVGGGAYAAIRYYGILDFMKDTPYELQEEAGSLIEKNLPQKTEESVVMQITEDSKDEKGLIQEEESPNDLFECSVKEALRDSGTITIVYEVSAKERGKYLFVPEDAIPEDTVPEAHGSRWDYSGDTTIKEYAAQNGLTVVNIGGGIENRSELGIIGQTMDFLSPEDDVMDIYVRGTLEAANSGQNVVCVATARSESDNRIVKERVAFSVEDRSEASVALYAPESDTAYSKDLNCTFIKAEVIQTDLGTYADIFFTRAEEGLWEEEYTLEMPDSQGGQIGGFIVETSEEGVYKTRIELGKTQLGESFSAVVCDIENDKEIQTITFNKQQ